MKDDIRPKGSVEVKCQAPDCEWYFWLEALDPRIVLGGPFFCSDHDGSPAVSEKVGAEIN